MIYIQLSIVAFTLSSPHAAADILQSFSHQTRSVGASPEAPLAEHPASLSSIPLSTNLPPVSPSPTDLTLSPPEAPTANESRSYDSTTNPYDFPLQARSKTTCDSNRFGSYLDRASCVEAWRRIGTDTTLYSVVQRRTSLTADGYLPIRYLSSETYYQLSSLCRRN